jgi:hypothetical protein
MEPGFASRCDEFSDGNGDSQVHGNGDAHAHGDEEEDEDVSRGRFTRTFHEDENVMDG